MVGSGEGRLVARREVVSSFPALGSLSIIGGSGVMMHGPFGVSDRGAFGPPTLTTTYYNEKR